jgi:hypothetical protein
MNKIESYYRKAPHFSAVKELFQSILFKTNSLQSINEQFIFAVAGEIGLDVIFKRSSDLLADHPYICQLSGNELVLELCTLTGTRTYISGTGCLDFIRPNSFQDRGIEFVFQHFVAQPYRQGHDSEFIPGLSVIDCLAFSGWKGVLKNLA